MSKMFLTVAHMGIHNGSSNGDIHKSLKYCIWNFKTSLKIWKYIINIFYTLKKRNLKAEIKTHNNR